MFRRLFITFTFMLLTFTLVAEAQQGTPARRNPGNSTRLRNATRGLQLNAPKDLDPLPCNGLIETTTLPFAAYDVFQQENEFDQVEITTTTLIATGQTLVLGQPGQLGNNSGSFTKVRSGYLPALCFAESPISATAIAPNGTLMQPLIWNSTDEVVFATPYTIVQLPLEAYLQPGRWTLSAEGAQSYTIFVDIPAPTTPFAILELNRDRFIVGGFVPGEIVYSPVIAGDLDVLDDFEFTVGNDGSALLEEVLLDGKIYLVGNAGDQLYYPKGTIFFEANPAIGDNDGDIEAPEMYDYLRRFYFQGETLPPLGKEGTAEGGSSPGTAIDFNALPLFYYNNTTGNTVVGRLSAEGKYADSAYPPQMTTGYTHEVGIGNGQVLFYDAGSGAGEILNITADQVPIQQSAYGAGTYTTGWTQIVYDDTSQRVFFYRASDGLGALVFVSPDGAATTLASYTLTPGWTNVAATNGWYIFYNIANGNYETMQFYDDGTFYSTGLNSSGGNFSPGWTHIIGYGGKLLFYNRGNGAMALGNFQQGFYSEIASYSLTPAWTHLVPVGDRLLFYNADLQTAEVGTFQADGSYVSLETGINFSAWTHISATR